MSHIAEKLHAYTLPRATPNTRVKDLPDLALLAQSGPLAAGRVRSAISQTFEFRKTHTAPGRLPAPPESWAEPYARMAVDDALPWPTLRAVTAAARSFLEPVLSAESDAQWNPQTWAWKAPVGSDV